MIKDQYIERVADLTDPENNILYNMTQQEAKMLLRTGDPKAVDRIDGQFALVAIDGKTVRLARSIGRPLRYFIAKEKDGPVLVVGDRIDQIYQFLKEEGLADQLHPSYTRMAPAHYITTLALVGCPDPNPTYERFFIPKRPHMKPDIQEIGALYISQVYHEIQKWLKHHATDGPIGVTFSGGIDSGSIFLLTYHAMLEAGMNPSRLKAFTLSIEGQGQDLLQSRKFLESLHLSLFHEPIEVSARQIDWRETIHVTEDYKPLDIQSATMNLALCKAIRQRYPDWRFLIDGDGGDENLKDYPIEENPELTIRSVLNNRLLYQEGWGVEAIKHSLTYSGGLSRGYTRTYAPTNHLGFDGFSPFTLPAVMEIAEAIPFIDLTDWNHEKLYQLKGQIVAAGVKAVTGIDLPVYPKRRFQHGTVAADKFAECFPVDPLAYRKVFNAMYE